jgi:hypothetical protein
MCAQASDPPAAREEQVVAALDAFLAVQQQRAQLYNRFDDAFRMYLRTKAEGPYRLGQRAVRAGGCNNTELSPVCIYWLLLTCGQQ